MCQVRKKYRVQALSRCASGDDSGAQGAPALSGPAPRQEESKERTAVPVRINGKQVVNPTAQRLLAAAKRHPAPQVATSEASSLKPSGHAPPKPSGKGPKAEAGAKPKGKQSTPKGKKPQKKPSAKKAKKQHNDTDYGLAKKEYAKRYLDSVGLAHAVWS